MQVRNSIPYVLVKAIGKQEWPVLFSLFGFQKPSASLLGTVLTNMQYPSYSLCFLHPPKSFSRHI